MSTRGFGWEIPWLVARAGDRPGTGPDPDIPGARWSVLQNDPLVFPGAMTDGMIVLYRSGTNYSGIHFNEAGLTEHGSRWCQAYRNALVPVPATLLPWCPGTAVLAGAARRRRRSA